MWRLAQDIGEDEEGAQEPSMMASVWLAVCDYRTWMFVAMQHCVLLAQTVTFFFPSVVKTLDYDNVTSEYSLLRACNEPWLIQMISTPPNVPNLGRNLHRNDAERLLRLAPEGAYAAYHHPHVRHHHRQHHDHHHPPARAALLRHVSDGHGRTVLLHGRSDVDLQYLPATTSKEERDHCYRQLDWECK